MYILTLHNDEQQLIFGYALDFDDMYELLKQGIHRHVILYGDPVVDRITQIQVLHNDIRDCGPRDPYEVVFKRIIGATVSEERTQAIPGLLEHRSTSLRDDDQRLQPFKRAIGAYQRKVRGIEK